MKSLKLMTIVGTRPEIIKMSQIIKRSDEVFDHILVHTGQNYDYRLNEIFFKDLGLREPDYYLNVVGTHLGSTMGNVISKSYELMAEVQPDAVIVLGDTNSCLAVISAKRLKIPIFHMEAGNRCFDENLPEEVNRRIVDITSDVNLCYSDHARKNLNAAGIPKERTFVVGSPMAEILNKHLESINNSTVLSRQKLEKQKYILLSAHREENIDNKEHFMELMEAVNTMAENFGLPVIYSTHPRSAKIIKERNFEFHPYVKSLKPFGFHDYNCLQKNAFCVVSDSGTLAEEAAYFHFPAVSVRTSTERPESVDKGVFTIGGISANSLLQAVTMETTLHSKKSTDSVVTDYTDTNVSMSVIKIIQGYTGIINKIVWRK